MIKTKEIYSEIIIYRLKINSVQLLGIYSIKIVDLCDKVNMQQISLEYLILFWNQDPVDIKLLYDCVTWGKQTIEHVIIF